MRKLFLILTLVLLTLPILVGAQETNSKADYTQAMGQRLNFSLNRNALVYNTLVKQSRKLMVEGENMSEVNAKLAETKIIIDQGQADLAKLPTEKDYLTAKQLVREVIRDIRQSYVKIKEIKLLIKNIN